MGTSFIWLSVGSQKRRVLYLGHGGGGFEPLNKFPSKLEGPRARALLADQPSTLKRPSAAGLGGGTLLLLVKLAGGSARRVDPRTFCMQMSSVLFHPRQNPRQSHPAFGLRCTVHHTVSQQKPKLTGSSRTLHREKVISQNVPSKMSQCLRFLPKWGVMRQRVTQGT